MNKLLIAILSLGLAGAVSLDAASVKSSKSKTKKSVAKAEAKPAEEVKTDAKAEAKPAEAAKAEAKPEATAEAKPAEAKVAETAATPAPTVAATPDAAAAAKAEEAAKAYEEPAKKAEAVSKKSPGFAGFMAAVPGFVVHGSGHMYAGSWMKGLGLMAVEGASLYIGMRAGLEGYGEIEGMFKATSNNTIPTDFSGAYTKVGLLTVSLSAFLWSWWDDIAGAPIAAQEYNRKADEAAQARFHLLPREDGAVLALSTRF